jgi:hypothetical protein
LKSCFTGEFAGPACWTFGRSIVDDGRCNVDELVVDTALEGAGDSVGGGMPALGAVVSLFVMGSRRSCRIVRIFW